LICSGLRFFDNCCAGVAAADQSDNGTVNHRVGNAYHVSILPGKNCSAMRITRTPTMVVFRAGI
jgi:hypothetical protein